MAVTDGQVQPAGPYFVAFHTWMSALSQVRAGDDESSSSALAFPVQIEGT